MGEVKDLIMENYSLKLEVKALKKDLADLKRAYDELLAEDTSLKY